MKCHKFIKLAAAGTMLAGVFSFLPAQAESVDSFPSKPITIVAHTGAGSSTDLFARELALAAEEVFGQPVVVTNRPGGGGATQMAILSSAKPDGYTVGVTTATHVTAMLTNLKGTYSPDDFAWIVLSQLDPYILAVHADSPYQSLDDIVKAAKAGTNLKIGGYGAVGSAHNVHVNLFADAAGIPFTWVSYPGAGDATTAVLGKHIDVVSANPGGTLPFVEGKRVRVLGILNEERISSLPDVPTYAEAGYEVDTSWKQLRGIYGPKDIPMEIQEKLADGFFKAMQSPRFQAYMKQAALEQGTYGPKEFPEFIDSMGGTATKWLTKLGIIK